MLLFVLYKTIVFWLVFVQSVTVYCCLLFSQLYNISSCCLLFSQLYNISPPDAQQARLLEERYKTTIERSPPEFVKPLPTVSEIKPGETTRYV